MPDAAWIRNASFNNIWAEVIDPLLLRSLRSQDGSEFAAPVADLLTLWLLYNVACRSGLSALVLQEPPWIVARVATAARALGHERIAALWEEATRGMDLPAWFGVFEIPFTSRAALDQLERELVDGDLNRELVEWLRDHAEQFADA